MTDTSIMLQSKTTKAFHEEYFESLLGFKTNYFRSYVKAPQNMLYDKEATQGSQPYSIFLHGEIDGDPQRGLTNPMYVKIDIHISMLREQREESSSASGDIITSWVAPPDGLLEWDRVERDSTQTAENCSCQIKSCIKCGDMNSDIGCNGQANATIDYRVRNDITFNGKYRRLLQLRSEYDFNQPHSFAAQLSFLLNNKMANEYSLGKQVDHEGGAIKAFRVRTVYKFIAYHSRVHDHILGNGGENNAPESRSGRYVGNTNTREMHDIKNITRACNFDLMSEKHKDYFNSIAEVEEAINTQGYNGCRWCMSKYDTG